MITDTKTRHRERPGRVRCGICHKDAQLWYLYIERHEVVSVGRRPQFTHCGTECPPPVYLTIPMQNGVLLLFVSVLLSLAGNINLLVAGPRPRAAARFTEWEDTLRLRLTESDQAYRAWSLAVSLARVHRQSFQTSVSPRDYF
jgi:hypothetical protein